MPVDANVGRRRRDLQTPVRQAKEVEAVVTGDDFNPTKRQRKRPQASIADFRSLMGNAMPANNTRLQSEQAAPSSSCSSRTAARGRSTLMRTWRMRLFAGTGALMGASMLGGIPPTSMGAWRQKVFADFEDQMSIVRYRPPTPRPTSWVSAGDHAARARDLVHRAPSGIRRRRADAWRSLRGADRRSPG